LIGRAVEGALLGAYLHVSCTAKPVAAIQRADRNIDELLEDLDRTFQRLRQSGIDEGLFDVTTGFEVLNVEEMMQTT